MNGLRVRCNRLYTIGAKSWWWDSNPRTLARPDYKSGAIATMRHQQLLCIMQCSSFASPDTSHTGELILSGYDHNFHILNKSYNLHL